MELEVAIPEQLDSRSDEELIADINAGDAAAFDILYFRYRDWVVNLSFRFTGDREIALDVLQETFIYLMKKFPGFRLTAQLKTFLYPAVRNLSIAARRKGERFQSSKEDLEKIEATPSLETTSGNNEDVAAVVASLSEEHREVLLLRFIDGLSLGEIAEALEIPLGTVKSRLHNGLATLRADPVTKKFFEQ